MKTAGEAASQVVRLVHDSRQPDGPADLASAESDTAVAASEPGGGLSATRQQRALARLATPLSPALRAALVPVTTRLADGRVVGCYPRLPDAAVDETEKRILALQALLQPLAPALIGTWLSEFAGMVRKPDNGKTLANTTETFRHSLELPAACFTPQSRMAAARALDAPWSEGGSDGYFPSLARLEKVLRPFGAAVERELAALQAVLDRRNGVASPRQLESPDRSVDSIPESEVRARMEAYGRAPRDRLTRIGITAFRNRLFACAPALHAQYAEAFERLLDYPDAAPAEPARAAPADAALLAQTGGNSGG